LKKTCGIPGRIRLWGMLERVRIVTGQRICKGSRAQSSRKVRQKSASHGSNLREDAVTIRHNGEIGEHRIGAGAPKTQKGREQHEHKRNA